MKTIIGEFEKYIGVHEYDGIVATIQTWYYGYVKHDAWCATSTSYMANQAGILDQLGGKQESVYHMMNNTKKLHQNDGRFWEYPNLPVNLRKHDVIFFQRQGISHVAHCYEDTVYSGSGKINVIGGNQSDMICVKGYNQSGIQAVYRPKYDTTAATWNLTTIREGDSGDDVYLLQRLLRAEGYKMQGGKLLGLSRRFGPQTKHCVEAFQSKNGLEVDGVVGPLTWGKLKST